MRPDYGYNPSPPMEEIMPEALDKSRRIVFTGASGGIGTMTRPLLAKLYPAWC